MSEIDLHIPPVIHGPILISYGDINGFEFGTKIENPYQQFFEREPDDVIANSIAVFYGDFKLPEAAAIEYVERARTSLKGNPQASLAAAQQAVAIVPDGFGANLALGDAAAATGDWATAKTAYNVATRRIDQMEPSAQEQWRPILEKKIAAARNNGT
jgi:hypothetical protein